MNWNLPNILTVLRLIAAPMLAVMFLYFNRPFADWFALGLFILASLTDFIDGYLARAWKQESKFGAMLDPIADKAMVVIALAVLIGFSSTVYLILFPATLILFREVFVSGLREYLGDKASLLKVTNLAKWKTTAQMIAISVLFSHGLFEHYMVMQTIGMDEKILADVLDGTVEDYLGLIWKNQGMIWSYYGGVVLLWIAAALTMLTGWDYLIKALPFLKDEPK